MKRTWIVALCALLALLGVATAEAEASAGFMTAETANGYDYSIDKWYYSDSDSALLLAGMLRDSGDLDAYLAAPIGEAYIFRPDSDDLSIIADTGALLLIYKIGRAHV